MGCVPSKEIATSRRSKLPGRAWKCAALPIVDGILKEQGKKNKKKAAEFSKGKLLDHIPQTQTVEILKVSPVEEINNVKTLAELLEEEPEVINVWELMEGLEDDLPCNWAETSESRNAPRQDDADVTESSQNFRGGAVIDQEDSSPEFVIERRGLESPRSPLYFESPVQCPIEARGEKPQQRISKRYGFARDLGPLVTSRNFSFNLKSSVDQVATPKVILDSTSPLLRSEGHVIGIRLGQDTDTTSSFARVSVDSAGSDADSIDQDLLSTFENMMEQLSSDDWLSTRPSNADSLEPESPVSGSEQIYPADSESDLNYDGSTKQKITLYFRTKQEPQQEHQNCCNVRSILMSYGISMEEKDISIHPKYRDELNYLIDESVPLPALFIHGRYIGGAEQLLEMKQKDQLRMLLNGSQKRVICNGCGGMCSIPCLDCNGSRKFITEDGELQQCMECTENGMVRCPLCS